MAYSTDPLEFEAFLRDFQRKNPSGTAFAPFAKRIQHGRTQVTFTPSIGRECNNYRIIDLSIITARVELFTETWYIHYAELIQT